MQHVSADNRPGLTAASLILFYSVLTALLVSSGANATQNVVYQNEEGQWVTDLAYYSSFEKEVDGKASEIVGQFQTENFVPACMYQVHSFIVILRDSSNVCFLCRITLLVNFIPLL